METKIDIGLMSSVFLPNTEIYICFTDPNRIQRFEYRSNQNSMLELLIQSLDSKLQSIFELLLHNIIQTIKSQYKNLYDKYNG